MPRDLSTEMPASFRAALDAALARPLLLEPRALPVSLAGGAFRYRADMGEGSSSRAPAPFTRDGDVAVVTVEGPLAQRAWSCWMFEGDGYDAIEGRVRAALADASTRAVVLRLDSPGGGAAGCFEAVRAIRAAAGDANKPLVAYVDEMAASAAYALACACDEIVCPDTGLVGSVGVIMQLCDESAAMALEGVAVSLVTSGAAKADGHPALPLSTDARARFQAEVDHLAGIFAAEVAKARPLAAADVLALEARVFHGSLGVAAGLADRVGPFASAVARARELASARRTQTPTGARRGASTPRTKTMEDATLKTLLGVESDAPEAALVERITALSALDRDVRAATGAGDPEAARGALRSIVKRAGEADAAEKALADERAAHQRAERTALKKHALSKALLTPAELGADASGAFSGPEAEWVAGMSTTALRGYLEREERAGKSVVPQGEHKGPSAPPTNDAQLPTEIAELAAKATRDGWASLSSREKHLVATHSKPLAARLRDAKR